MESFGTVCFVAAGLLICVVPIAFPVSIVLVGVGLWFQSHAPK